VPSFSRCGFASELCHVPVLNRHHRHNRSQNGILRTPMRCSMRSHSVLMPVEAFASAASARMTERTVRTKMSEAKRRQTQGSCAAPTGAAAPLSGEAHIYRRSTAVLVPRSLSSQGTQHQASASWDVAEELVAPPSGGRYPPLPVPVQRCHRSLVIVPGG